MKKWWVGCSGFHYKGWKGKFYPEDLPQRKWFEFYCQSFNTIELNVTFYRFPRVTNLQTWYKQSPEGFMFTVKASKFITHYRRFNNATRQLHDFYSIIADGLEDKLGPVLFQMHPSMVYEESKLEQIINSMDPAFVNVLEFRHPSWWRTNVIKALTESNISFCSISHPTLPADIYKTAPTMYYRFHGVPHLYLSSYSDKQLQQVVSEIKRKRNVADVYLYFNNDIEVAAVSNAKSVQRLLSEKKTI